MVWKAEQGGVNIGKGVLVAVDGELGVEELFQLCPLPGWRVEQPVEEVSTADWSQEQGFQACADAWQGEGCAVVHWGQGRPGAVKWGDVSVYR